LYRREVAMVDEVKNRKHSGKSGVGNPRIKTLDSPFHNQADPIQIYFSLIPNKSVHQGLKL
jgi:hypothetical protein